MNIVVTGGAGFIGANFLNMMVPRMPQHQFINVDKLTYAANLLSLKPILDAPNYQFRRVDIAQSDAVAELFGEFDVDIVVHFAAESHVDRSIVSPGDFIYTNIVGTFNLLEACRKQWKDRDGKLFHHVSTDEVFGSLEEQGYFTEDTRYDPSSPYSASKASSDHLVRAYGRTYSLPYKLTNCSNNYGPLQFPEKLIPLMIQNALNGRPLPVYGQGLNVRDWLYVGDHCEAIWQVIEHGVIGRSYNIGGHNEKRNIDVVFAICSAIAAETGRPVEEFTKLITYVTDRPGHDLRYAIDPSRMMQELGWKPTESFESGLRKTVKWYLDNTEWIHSVQTGEYRRWMDQNYGDRAEVQQ